MKSDFVIVDPSEHDVYDIVLTLRANRNDPSMFLRSPGDISRNLKDFIISKDINGRIIGCAALHQYNPALGEILSVAVLPEFQGQGVGNHLIENRIRQADLNGIQWTWLATVKPVYFGRFGFTPFSRWKLPVSVLIHKLNQVFQQPLRRWSPAIFGKFTFMERHTETRIS
jgi:N-acetylglutamate synthase-like GNAT family acetyltransferase